MKLVSTFTLAAVALMITASTSFGLVGYDISAGVLPVADNSQLNLVADLNDDGLDLTDPDDFAPGVDDTVIASFPMNSFLGIAGGGSFSLSNLDVTGLTGAKLYLVFYNTPFSAVATGAGPGVAVGAVGNFAAGTFGLGGNAWSVAAENGSYTINFVSDSVGQAFQIGNTGFADADFSTTTNTPTIPEPASMVLMGLGGLLLARGRRK